MLAPVVKQAAQQSPDAEFTVLSRPFCQPLFEGLAPNVHFIGADPKKDYQGIRGLYRLFRQLHEQHFSLICDCHDVLRTKVLRLFFRLYGYRIRTINKHRRLRKLITAPEGKKQLQQLPTSFQNYAEVLGALSRPDGHPFLRSSRCSGTSWNPLEGQGAIQLAHSPEVVHSSGILAKAPVALGIAPFAAHKGKIYPAPLMERVIAMLSTQKPDSTIYLFGGKGKEEEQMRRWAAAYPNVKLAADSCHGLADELQLMRSLTVMLSMDSANMHLASLVGTPVVSIWGATHPYAGFLGWQQSLDDCIQLDMPCRPCSIYGNKPCHKGADYPCLQHIKPEMVVQRIIRHF